MIESRSGQIRIKASNSIYGGIGGFVVAFTAIKNPIAAQCVSSAIGFEFLHRSVSTSKLIFT
ncbi:hypothetical protein [Paenibacillus sp. N3.4]|uniref:hypothetical protein n=1 Tax=Paenibacillus sp. N3.4 TaxID=2603222 RepID=UPI0011C900BC|nr:hypothetical protein [Paenibacillus sp. N3.4]TXK81461.1 hypothetical protein FU659_16320 [Paenibacillus sp. N3.4]